MSNEFDLDSLKSAWQEQKAERSYSSNDIFQMLKRKSMTSVKWIFTISLIELVLGAILYVVSIVNPELFSAHSELDYGDMTYLLVSISVIGYIITVYFVYSFFKSYKAISVQASVKELSLDIINFRKIANRYIYFNLILFIIGGVASLIAVFNMDPEYHKLNLSGNEFVIFVCAIVLIVLVIFALIWLYYYLVYGIFLRRLKKNLKDLETIE